MSNYRNLTARDIMVRKVITLRPQMEVMDAIRVMMKHKIAGAPVVNDHGRYLGVFSEKSSLSVLLGMEYDSDPTTEIRSYVDTTARFVHEDTDMLSIVDIFLNEPYRRLPVLRDKDELVGLVCRRDVLRAFNDGMRKRQKATGDSGILYFSSVTQREDSTIIS
ncbi:CBS domain-containing protein [Rubinisphaera sp.]|uniref:CBS domain-containing protein n=1 Tax=Rubinisphaera sp. TaxID=2024857 RepID=UPI000C0D3CD4|nr:CBS domain-containing protein [Rubinisphaera sp.]MBV12080.1 inosine-5-monophosphate dehydrogenase [Rubinisphaera sp.]|tara:strand:+ start:11086 stop:11574 length:489 start_codon:yes stop_codon:yes gene_type:complete